MKNSSSFCLYILHLASLTLLCHICHLFLYIVTSSRCWSTSYYTPFCLIKCTGLQWWCSRCQYKQMHNSTEFHIMWIVCVLWTLTLCSSILLLKSLHIYLNFALQSVKFHTLHILWNKKFALQPQKLIHYTYTES